MVSHDLKEVAYMADRIVVLSANPGRIRTIDREPPAPPARPPLAGARARWSTSSTT